MNAYYSLRFVLKRNKKRIKGNANEIKYYAALLNKVVFDIAGNNNKIFIGENTSLFGCKFTIRGDNHIIRLGANGIYTKCNFATEDNDCVINIGSDTTMYEGCEIASVEPFAKVEIGSGCMFSSNVDVRNTDSHSIIDIDSNKRINPGKNIKLGDRVWAGTYVQILKGVNIGNDCVLGIRSLINKDVPSNCVVAGVPAKVVKENIYWLKERV